MKWINFVLKKYQPPSRSKDTSDDVVNNTLLPIFMTISIFGIILNLLILLVIIKKGSKSLVSYMLKLLSVTNVLFLLHLIIELALTLQNDNSLFKISHWIHWSLVNREEFELDLHLHETSSTFDTLLNKFQLVFHVCAQGFQLISILQIIVITATQLHALCFPFSAVHKPKISIILFACCVTASVLLQIPFIITGYIYQQNEKCLKYYEIDNNKYMDCYFNCKTVVYQHRCELIENYKSLEEYKCIHSTFKCAVSDNNLQSNVKYTNEITRENCNYCKYGKCSIQNWFDKIQNLFNAKVTRCENQCAQNFYNLIKSRRRCKMQQNHLIDKYHLDRTMLYYYGFYNLVLFPLLFIILLILSTWILAIVWTTSAVKCQKVMEENISVSYTVITLVLVFFFTYSGHFINTLLIFISADKGLNYTCNRLSLYRLGFTFYIIPKLFHTFTFFICLVRKSFRVNLVSFFNDLWQVIYHWLKGIRNIKKI